MMRSRCTVSDALPVTISPPFGERAKLAMARYTPMRRMRSGCCAPAASGHAAARARLSIHVVEYGLPCDPPTGVMQLEWTISHLDVLRCGISAQLLSAPGLGC